MRFNRETITEESAFCKGILNFLKKNKKRLQSFKNVVYLHPQLRDNRLLWSVRLGVRTHGFHPCNTGSIPVRTTKVLNKNDKTELWQITSQH
jgi:hypothetical protein